MIFKNKKVLVMGMGRSGNAAAKLLLKNGALVSAWDSSENVQERFPELKFENFENNEANLKNYDLAILSPGIPIDHPIVLAAKEAGVVVWGELELASRFTDLPIIAITGTNGKTTVTTLVGDILRKAGRSVAVLGNIGEPFSGAVLETNQIIVAEVSSFQLESVSLFAPRISAILNITPDHLDRHYSMENYIWTKKRIFMNHTPDDILVLSYDDPNCRNITGDCRIIYFSRKEINAPSVFESNGAIISNFSAKKRLEICKLEEINMIPENALAAAAIALAAGAPIKAIKEGLMAFKGAPHRIEFLGEFNGVAFYNDSKATNSESAIRGLSSMKRPTILIAGGYDKLTDMTKFANTIKALATHTFLIGETAQKIARSLDETGCSEYSIVYDLESAVKAACKTARPGMAVLLSPACASFDQFKNFEARGSAFSELVKKYGLL